MPDIVKHNEVWLNRTAGAAEGGESRYVRTFRVVTSSALIGGIPVCNDPRTPRRYDSYRDQAGNVDIGSYCKSVEAQQQETPWVWLVTCTYSSRKDDPDPLSRLPERDWSTTKFVRPVAKDINNKAIVNGAGDAFDPPVEKEESRITLTITRNEAADNSLVVHGTYIDRVNKGVFETAPPGTVKLSMYDAKRVIDYDKNMIYWACKYVFEFKAESWQPSVMNRGFNARKVFGGPISPMRDARTGTQFTVPQPLDASGIAIPPGGGDPQFITFKIYQEAEFNDLGFI